MRNVYVAVGNKVLKVTPAGKITTFAGTGVHGYSGDGGPAVKAKLAGPRGLAVDRAGNVYISEPFGQRVRKVWKNR